VLLLVLLVCFKSSSHEWYRYGKWCHYYQQARQGSKAGQPGKHSSSGINLEKAWGGSAKRMKKGFDFCGKVQEVERLETGMIRGNRNRSMADLDKKMGLEKPLPMPAPGELAWVTVNNRVKKSKYKMDGAFTDIMIINAGSEIQKWGGVLAKNMWLLRWLSQAKRRIPDQIAVLSDGDIISGGCTAAELLKYYKTTVTASDGAVIVIGAEFHAYPNVFCGAVHDRNETYQHHFWSKRRTNVLEAHGLPEAIYADYVDCSRDLTCACCSYNPRYEFLNFGFVMGPISQLYPFMEFIALHCCKAYMPPDQGLARDYMFAHPDLVTLDYTGLLSLQMGAIYNPDFLKVQKRPNGQVVVFNNVTETVSCVLHGNSLSKVLVEEFKGKVAAAKKGFV